MDDREEDVDEACSCARSMILFDAEVEDVTLVLFSEGAEDTGDTARVAVVVADVEAFKTLLVEEMDDAKEAALLLLFFEAMLALARQLVGLRAEEAGGIARVAIVVTDVETLETLLVEGVDGTEKAALLLLLFFEAVLALAELVGLRTEDTGDAEVLSAMLIALPALVLRSGVPSDLNPDAAVAVVALEGGRITLVAAGEVDKVGCFSLDWTVGLFPVMLALEAASAISRLVC